MRMRCVRDTLTASTRLVWSVVCRNRFPGLVAHQLSRLPLDSYGGRGARLSRAPDKMLDVHAPGIIAIDGYEEDIVPIDFWQANASLPKSAGDVEVPVTCQCVGVPGLTETPLKSKVFERLVRTENFNIIAVRAPALTPFDSNAGAPITISFRHLICRPKPNTHTAMHVISSSRPLPPFHRSRSR